MMREKKDGMFDEQNKRLEETTKKLDKRLEETTKNLDKTFERTLKKMDEIIEQLRILRGESED